MTDTITYNERLKLSNMGLPLLPSEFSCVMSPDRETAIREAMTHASDLLTKHDIQEALAEVMGEDSARCRSSPRPPRPPSSMERVTRWL